MSVKVLVACGSGIVTSTLLEDRLKEIAQENGLDIAINKMSMNQLQSGIPDADLVVTTSNYKAGDVGVKVMAGTSVITGIGEDKFIEDFIASIKALSK